MIELGDATPGVVGDGATPDDGPTCATDGLGAAAPAGGGLP
jgi:hypothetical protein